MKLEIAIHNSTSFILTPLPPEISNEVSNFMSYLAPEFFNSKNKNWQHKKVAGRIYLFNPKTQSFPTGLLSSLKSIKSFKNLNFIYKDLRIIPDKTINLSRKNSPKLRDYQIKIINDVLQKERGTIEAATGVGKTTLMQEIIYKYKLPALIIVPTVNLLRQTADFMSNIFGRNKVYALGDGTPYKRLLQKKRIPPIIISTVQTLPSVDAEFFKNINLLLVDETHRAAAVTYQTLNTEKFNHIYYRYFLSGTPFRNSSDGMALHSVIGDTISVYGIRQAMKDKWLCPVKFIINQLQHSDDALSYSGDWMKEHKNLVVQNNAYNKIIAQIVNTIDESKNPLPTIVFVREIEQGKNILKHCKHAKLITGQESSIINKQLLKDFSQRKFNTLIGTSVIGEGVDVPLAQVGIIASGGKARSEIIQKIGRLLRPSEGKKHATIIDFTHHGSLTLHSHFQRRLEIYRSYLSEELNNSIVDGAIYDLKNISPANVLGVSLQGRPNIAIIPAIPSSL